MKDRNRMLEHLRWLRSQSLGGKTAPILKSRSAHQHTTHSGWRWCVVMFFDVLCFFLSSLLNTLNEKLKITSSATAHKPTGKKAFAIATSRSAEQKNFVDRVKWLGWDFITTTRTQVANERAATTGGNVKVKKDFSCDFKVRKWKLKVFLSSSSDEAGNLALLLDTFSIESRERWVRSCTRDDDVDGIWNGREATREREKAL